MRRICSQLPASILCGPLPLKARSLRVKYIANSAAPRSAASQRQTEPRCTRQIEQIALSDRSDRRSVRGNAVSCEAVERETREAPGSPQPLALQPGEVHTWWLSASQVQSPVLQDQYMRLLPEEEQAYVREGANAQIQKERLLARTLVRVTLSRYCAGQIPPPQLSFKSSPSGKPWLVSEEACSFNGRPLHFNLTHTSDLLGVAVSRGCCVGLDVESTSRLTKSDPLQLARRRFSEREFTVLQGFGDKKERAQLFLRLWTLKEAYVKATGRGISAAPGLKAFTFELLLQTSVKRRATPSAKPNNGENGASKPAEMDGQSSRGAAVESAGPAVSALRLPFWIQFCAAPADRTAWEAVLMDVSGGHTAALVVEAGEPNGGDLAAPLRLRVFNTVPLLSEEEASDRDFRIIGYGRSS